jgi:hypothetical protein
VVYPGIHFSSHSSVRWFFARISSRAKLGISGPSLLGEKRLKTTTLAQRGHRLVIRLLHFGWAQPPSL